jgi:hypothetical protein
MNPLQRGRSNLPPAATQTGRAVARPQDAVGNTAAPVANTVARPVAQDGFESAPKANAVSVRGLFGFGSKPDKVHDGKLVGAGGQTFAPGTPLKDIPGVTPKNNPNPKSTILYVNGINTTKEAQSNSLQAIADKADARVIGIHNATEGMATDLVQCVKDKLDKGKNPAVDTLADTLYTEIKAGRDVHLMAHSQGGLISSRALGDVYKRLRIEDGMAPEKARELMGKINVETFGAAAMNYPDGPNYVHYVNRGDPVPGLFGLGPVADKWNPAVDGGKGSKVHHFNEFKLNPIDAHHFESIYLQERVPFDQARAGKFE